jgi:hypothetical protein
MNDVNVDRKWPDVIDIYQVHLHRSSFMDHMKFTFNSGIAVIPFAYPPLQ